MTYQNRPYRGRAAELDELNALTTSAVNSLPQKDTVVEAGKKCLLIGGLTAPLFIGFPFLGAAFVLGIYAMATDRMKQGMKISLVAVILLIVLFVVLYVAIIGGIAVMLFQGTNLVPASAKAVPFEQIEPLQQLTSINPSKPASQLPPTTFRWSEPRRQSTLSKPNPSKTKSAETERFQASSTQPRSEPINETRQDHIIPRGKLTHVPGFGRVKINHNHAFVYFSTFSAQKPREIRKITGLHPTDTNRTLLSKSGSSSLYFVDTIVGSNNVQVAVITE